MDSWQFYFTISILDIDGNMKKIILDTELPPIKRTFKNGRIFPLIIPSDKIFLSPALCKILLDT